MWNGFYILEWKSRWLVYGFVLYYLPVSAWKLPVLAYTWIFHYSTNNLSVFCVYACCCYFLSWTIITLQCCVNFCCIAMCVNYTYISPILPISTPLGHHRAPSWAPCVTKQLPTSYFTHDNIYMSTLLSQSFPPFLLPQGPQLCSLCLHLFLTLQVGSL